MARFEVKVVAYLLMKNFNFNIKPVEENFVNGPVLFYTNPVMTTVTKIE